MDTTSRSIAMTIIEQLKGGTDGYNRGVVLMMCWGYRQPTIIESGLSFKVSGRFVKGAVEIVLDQGADMYNIVFKNVRSRVLKEVKGVFFDDLTRIVDCVVEKEGI